MSFVCEEDSYKHHCWTWKEVFGSTKNVIAKYNSRVEAVNSLLCVGLDSDFEKLPEEFKKREHPQFKFNKWIIEQTHEYVAAYKPNAAFYEARGAEGIADLKL